MWRKAFSNGEATFRTFLLTHRTVTGSTCALNGFIAPSSQSDHGISCLKGFVHPHAV